jgi:hypothetical protein
LKCYFKNIFHNEECCESPINTKKIVKKTKEGPKIEEFKNATIYATTERTFLKRMRITPFEHLILKFLNYVFR